ncbi:hypothetical protein NDU88_013323 [Pleurodeles waltl]|uniref:Uncharacterized protein n=1 Tax=Pleurodeles waltl TaxID=8319 RepID=A0AAV7R3F9_PLEWA|nr:hypothetical protein NDU88_013323 [Pleurodeles waltl]
MARARDLWRLLVVVLLRCTASTDADIPHKTLPAGSDFSIPTQRLPLVSLFRNQTHNHREHIAFLANGTVTLFSSNFSGRLIINLTDFLTIQDLRPEDSGLYVLQDEPNKSIIQKIYLTVSAEPTTPAVYSSNTTDPKARGRVGLSGLLAVLLLVLVLLAVKRKSLKHLVSRAARPSAETVKMMEGEPSV